MEEDEADDQRGSAVLEKGASEKGKEEEEDEEEEGGITFKVRSSSTPDERRDRKHAVSPLPVPPLTPNTLTAPKGDMSSHSPATRPEKSSQSSQPIPGACATMVQPQSQICTSTSTATSSSGIYFLNPSLDMQNSTRTVFFKSVIICFSVHNPGKCQSSTFSTYTFTTCRILHPSDVTQVSVRQVLFKR